MLKWTVMARKESDRPDRGRRASAGPGTLYTDLIPSREKVKRRRSCTSRRLSSILNRNSLDVEVDKENQFTSTPIKSFDDHHQFDVLRDVSNLTPNDPTYRRVVLRSNKKCNRKQESEGTSPATAVSSKKHKKKKKCLDPFHEFITSDRDYANKSTRNYFRPFEAVDSHIKGLALSFEDRDGLEKKELPVKRRIRETYAPTLPTLSMEYSPCLMPSLLPFRFGSPTKATPIGKFLALEQSQPSRKKPRIDHINDFLNQISSIRSPDEEDELKFPHFDVKSNAKNKRDTIVSPLVRKFVDLRFSQLSFDNNLLSVQDELKNSPPLDDLSLEQLVDAILDESEPNPDQIRKNVETNSNSSDSGFRSSTTVENSHRLDGNFACQQCCLKISSSSIEFCDKTIININETFNERCVDEIKSRKRRSSSLENRHDNSDFTLKRQRCIRRKRIEEDKKSASFVMKEDQSLLEISGRIADYDKSTPVKNTESTTTDEVVDRTFILTPVDTNNRRFRRCLLFESPTSLSESVSTTNYNIGDVKGCMDLNIRYAEDHLYVHVIRCKDLYRPNGKQVNAYVKVALIDQFGDNRRSRKNRGILQRTTVQADSCKPFFNHTFKVPLKQNELSPKRLQIEVWHRDRSSRTSEFLGCMSFDARHAYKKDISGSYRLLPQTTGRCQNVAITPDNQFAVCNIESEPAQTTDTNYPTTMFEESQSSVEEIMSFDDVDSDLKKTTSKTVLSEQQKYADENLFLRYLELDPTEGPDAPAAATQRKATGNRNGRTPFTQTKKLTRAPKSGFGFSVVWTHPPRIERVEKGLPADKAGILPGDYIIFVDKHNVVMMPEIDILNLIRSFGCQLTLEIFRRSSSTNGSVPSVRRLNSTETTASTIGLPAAPTPNLVQQLRRPSTVCSTNTTSVDYNTRKLYLPQVTFSSEKPTSNQDENRKRAMYQILNREQQYATGLQFAVTRFVSALAERQDLITPLEHKILFQNSDEILRITEDIIDNLMQDDGEPHLHVLLRTYVTKLGELTSAYKRYCSGIKKADCVLANKTKDSNSDFVRFLHTPSIPRRRPDITTFIHKPLEHYREILKLLTVIQSSTKSNQEEYPVINQIVHDLQLCYREMTAEAGLMEPMGEGRPLLTVQDLENRLVFTKCKPFVLEKPGRQWIFGGDLGRVEGRNVRQYWTLLFSDLLLFAKVSRDRVLFVIEEPIQLVNISDMFFNVRKKDTEFRLTICPGGKNATSPTAHCGPDLTRTPKKNASKRTVILRAPTTELKAVWQNLLQRQIFHVNSGMDGSSFSSPLESPDAPITSSVATLQSAESLSFRRQTPHNINENLEMHKQIDALIENKCKQWSKTNSGKGNAIHLEKWMKGELDSDVTEGMEMEPLSEEWTKEMLRKRSEELQLIDSQGNITCRTETRQNNSKFEDLNLSDHDQSPSRSTTTESQVTVRSSPLISETVPVCRQCHKNCHSTLNNTNTKTQQQSLNRRNDDINCNEKVGEDDDDDWRTLFVMGLTSINPAASLVKLDPFAAPVPRIPVSPPTLKNSTRVEASSMSESKKKEETCCCHQSSKPLINKLDFSNAVEISPDDSPQTEEHPYHSLSSSNITLRRFGTVSSLERVESEENWEDNNNSSGSDDDREMGQVNEAFYNSSIRNWTAKAGSYVAEKMSFFEEYRAPGKFFERYLKTSEATVNGDEAQEEETSGATSGEEIWGTPTSGGELDDPLSSPTNYEGRQSPYDGSISSENGDDTELMMDELLMTPPITGAIMRGLLPRRTLEPLIEEDFSDSCSTTSSRTPTEPSISPDQGIGTGDVADICSTAVEKETKTPSNVNIQVPSVIVTSSETDLAPRMPRSESYRRIVEAAEEVVVDHHLGFFEKFRPTIKFVNIERVPRTKSVKIFEFFNMKRERRIHQSIAEGRQVIKVFSKEGTVSDKVPTSYSDQTLSPRRLKDKQLDRRFWKQLSKRRGSKSPNPPA